MNIHHLELFYFVARHGGIMEAVRKMPYGIQQPAVSGQILQLEADLGLKLFERRPFELTAAGQELYAFIQPFFGNVEQVGARLRGGVAQVVRMAAPEIALRDHLPELLRQVRQRFPKLQLTLRMAHQPEVESLLERHEIDFAVTLVEGRPVSGLSSEALLQLPVVLLVRDDAPWRSALEIFDALAKGAESIPLITLPPNELAPRRLREFLSARGDEWNPAIEVTALTLIETYVGGGFGVGLTVQVPGTHVREGLRFLPVPGIQPLVLGALWRGKLLPVTEALLQALRERAKQMEKNGNSTAPSPAAGLSKPSPAKKSATR